MCKSCFNKYKYQNKELYKKIHQLKNELAECEHGSASCDFKELCSDKEFWKEMESVQTDLTNEKETAMNTVGDENNGLTGDYEEKCSELRGAIDSLKKAEDALSTLESSIEEQKQAIATAEEDLATNKGTMTIDEIKMEIDDITVMKDDLNDIICGEITDSSSLPFARNELSLSKNGLLVAQNAKDKALTALNKAKAELTRICKIQDALENCLPKIIQ